MIESYIILIFQLHILLVFFLKKIYNLIGNYNLKFKVSADYDLYFRLYKKGLNGGFTKKISELGMFASGGYSSKISYFEHLIEESKIRIHNKQNIYMVLLIFINSLIKHPLKFLGINNYELLFLKT